MLCVKAAGIKRVGGSADFDEQDELPAAPLWPADEKRCGAGEFGLRGQQEFLAAEERDPEVVVRGFLREAGDLEEKIPAGNEPLIRAIVEAALFLPEEVAS